jgi:pyridoxine 5-phosphate synthase
LTIIKKSVNFKLRLRLILILVLLGEKMKFLSVNVDHVATIREARKDNMPDPVTAALLAEKAGADSITVHLREDRRHIQDRDVTMISKLIKTSLNLEMAATEEMLRVAYNVRPHLVTLVPEKREEITTEGGLDLFLKKEQ